MPVPDRETLAVWALIATPPGACAAVGWWFGGVEGALSGMAAGVLADALMYGIVVLVAGDSDDLAVGE